MASEQLLYLATSTRSIFKSNLSGVLDIVRLVCSRRYFSMSVCQYQLCHGMGSKPTGSHLYPNHMTTRSLASKSKRRMIPFDDSRFSEQPIVYVNATYNNTMLTLTDHKGNTLAWSSAGSEGYKNSKRGSSVAAQQAALSLAKKATEFGVQRVRIKIKGVGNGRQASVKSLATSGLKLVSITDVTPIPHNGCRPKKARRI